MRGFEAFFNMIDREFWGISLRDRKDSREHDIARARQIARAAR